MIGHGGSSAGSYLANPTSPIPSHCASIVMTSTLRVKSVCQDRKEIRAAKRSYSDIWTLYEIDKESDTLWLIDLNCITFAADIYMCIITLIASMCVVGLGGFHTMLVSTSRTTLEQVRMCIYSVGNTCRLCFFTVAQITEELPWTIWMALAGQVR